YSVLTYPPHHQTLPTFPTRRSSDLATGTEASQADQQGQPGRAAPLGPGRGRGLLDGGLRSLFTDLRGGFAHESFLMHQSPAPGRSEEHTSELQSRENLVCRLLLEKT